MKSGIIFDIVTSCRLVSSYKCTLINDSNRIMNYYVCYLLVFLNAHLHTYLGDITWKDDFLLSDLPSE